MPRSQRCPPQAGFTLIELLVSLTVLGVILALLAGGLRVLSRGWDRNAERIETLDMVARAADILRRDASGLQRVVTAVGGNPSYVFSGTRDRLDFVTLEPPYPSAAGPYFVSYSVAGKGRNADLIRARARYRPGMRKFPGATPANQVHLLEGPFRYRFAYAQKSAGHGEWRDAWSDATRMPELIRLQIIDARRNAPVAPPLVVAIAADAELSCLSEKSDLCSPKSEGVLAARAKPASNDQSVESEH